MKPMMPIAFAVVLALVAVAAWALPGPGAQAPLAVGQRMPPLKGDLLSGKRGVLPDLAAGRTTLVILGFSYDSRFQVEAWAEKFRARYGTTPDVTLFEVPMMGSAARLGRWFIDSGMRKNTPAGLHDRVMTVYGGNDDWKARVGFSAPNDAYLVLIDREGIVRWLAHGAVSEERLRELVARRRFARQRGSGRTLIQPLPSPSPTATSDGPFSRGRGGLSGTNSAGRRAMRYNPQRSALASGRRHPVRPRGHHVRRLPARGHRQPRRAGDACSSTPSASSTSSAARASPTIALFTEPDRRARFVREADESYHLGPATFVDDADGQRKPTYLDYERLEQALVAVQADAVWAGWGFVAERADFVELCDRLGVTFIGPSSPGDPAARRQDLGQAARRAGGPPGDAVGRRGGRHARRRLGARAAPRLPGARQGVGRGGRPRHPARLERGGTAGGVRRRAAGGGPDVRRLHRLRGAVARGRPSRRGADARRPRRRAVGARRARLHDPAAVPEADRRGAVAGAARRRGAGAQGGGHPPVPRRRLPGRGHGGVPVRPGDARSSSSWRSTRACRSSTR